MNQLQKNYNKIKQQSWSENSANWHLKNVKLASLLKYINKLTCRVACGDSS